MERKKLLEMRDMPLISLVTVFLALSGISWFVEFDSFSVARTVRYGLIVATTAAVVTCLIILYLRRKRLQRYTWIPSHKILIDPGGFHIEHSQVTMIVDRVTYLWESEIKWPAQNLLAENPLYINFRPLPLINPAGANVLGYAVPHSFEVYVGMSRGDRMSDTSLEHEINHLLYGHLSQKWDENVHHDFFRDYGFK
jgi:hypothetical protein